MNTIETLKREILTCIQKHFSLPDEQMAPIELTLNSDKREPFGDMSCNAALVLAKVVGKNPRELATEIQELCTQQSGTDTLIGTFLEKVEIAGPGFCNFFVKQSYWPHVAAQLFTDAKGFFSYDANTPTKKYLIEFVSANPTGPLHLGHGRGGIIGDVLANVLLLLGHEARREYYINDAGSQVKKLGRSLQIRCLQLTGEDVELPEDAYAGEYLVDLAQKYIEKHGTDNLATTDRRTFQDFGMRHLLAAIKKTLSTYGITFDEWFSERSLQEGAVERALDILRSKDLLYEKENALWFKASEFGDDQDRVIRKTDGDYTYIVSDIAYHKNKFDRGFDYIIDILGQDHHGYVQRLKGTMKALGYPAENLHVILYQLVKIKAGGVAVKMSKRAGTFTELAQVIDMVGTDVARFFYLNRKAECHLDFDLETALKKTDENPVFYIHYAFVRTNSLLNKAAENPDLADFVKEVRTGIHGQTLKQISALWNEAEHNLIKKIASLQRILHTIETSYQTHLLSFYTLELAQLFHQYYASNKIINPEKSELSQARLCMVGLIRSSLGLCLDLLGLSKPEKM